MKINLILNMKTLYANANKLLVIIFLGLITASNAQDFKPILPNISQKERLESQIPNLKIGDYLPSFIIPKLLWSEREINKSTDFIDQLLIVDFWNTGCKGCILAMPTMDSLQKQFGNKIKILPVTFEKSESVKQFWKNNKYLKNISLNTVVEDRIFSAYFKHIGVPHEVWIYKGKVVAITNSEYVDAFHINQILSGVQIQWPLKDDYLRFDFSKALFPIDSNQVDVKNTVIKYAAICDYKEGVSSNSLSGGGGIFRDSIKKTVRAYFLNEPVFGAFVNLLSKTTDFKNLVKPSKIIIDPNQIVWETSNRKRFQYISRKLSGYDEDWIRQNGMCFESLNPDTGQTDLQVYKSMLLDLRRLLGVNGRWEKRREKIYTLVEIGNNNRSVAKGKLASTLAYELNQIETNPYVFDQTKSKVLIPNEIIASTSIIQIAELIKPYGLDLKEEIRDVHKLVFSETGENSKFIDANLIQQYKFQKSQEKFLKPLNPKDTINFFEKNGEKAGVFTTPTGLQYLILNKGDGKKPGIKDKVKVNYTGMLLDGKIFDSSMEKGLPSIFLVTGVIKGWTEALLMMPEGSKWKLYVPAKLAYGEHTINGRIPPNSILIFEVELMAIIK